MSAAADRARQAALDGARAAVRDAAEAILRDSDASLPVGDPAQDPDPSFALVEHGRITYSDDGLVATVHYDGPYAAKQHEAQHFEHPRGGKPKFLEDALKAKLPELPGIVAGEVRARIDKERRRARANARR